MSFFYAGRTLERQFITAEINQRKEEGCDVEEISPRISAALECRDNDADLVSLYNELMELPVSKSFPYEEPSSLDEIKKTRPISKRKYTLNYNDVELFDRIYGAWLGRTAGCALGKPVEGWSKDQIDKYLVETNLDSLKDYFPFNEKWIMKSQKFSTQGNIQFMDRDDDMDYTILGLLALERHGDKLNSKLMALNWMENFPFGMACTAEYSAYRNFALDILPPESGIYRNPFREWIGAQIRADAFGYAAPGWPEKAAELAFYDGAISHDKNGIYGEMFVAAMISSAFVLNDAEQIINAGLGEIPKNCRLARAVKDTLEWCKTHNGWIEVWEKINKNYGHYHGVHTINNAALVVMGIWFGVNDFEAGIVNTVRGGWDTDCTGASVGSVLGAIFGASKLPKKWTGVFNDTLKSAVARHSENKISNLAKRTLQVANKILHPTDQVETYVLDSSVGGIWSIDGKWGKQVLNFENGTIDFMNELRGVEDKATPLRSSEYSHPHVKFSYAIDKGGWDFVVEFTGAIDGNTLEGFYSPGMIPVKAVKVESK